MINWNTESGENKQKLVGNENFKKKPAGSFVEKYFKIQQLLETLLLDNVGADRFGTFCGNLEENQI